MEGKTRVTRAPMRSGCMRKEKTPRDACLMRRIRSVPRTKSRPASKKSPAPPNPSPGGLPLPHASPAWGNSPSDQRHAENPSPGDASEGEKRVPRRLPHRERRQSLASRASRVRMENPPGGENDARGKDIGVMREGQKGRGGSDAHLSSGTRERAFHSMKKFPTRRFSPVFST